MGCNLSKYGGKRSHRRTPNDEGEMAKRNGQAETDQEVAYDFPESYTGVTEVTGPPPVHDAESAFDAPPSLESERRSANRVLAKANTSNSR